MISETDSTISGPEAATPSQPTAADAVDNNNESTPPVPNVQGSIARPGSGFKVQGSKLEVGSSKFVPSFSIPPSDGPAFASLPHGERRETQLKLARLRQIHNSGNLQRECNRISAALKANGGHTGTVRGQSSGRLLAMYYDYTRYGKTIGDVAYPAGDWRIVVNWSKAGPCSRSHAQRSDAPTLPAAFLVFWRKLCDDHQRVTSEAYRELLQIWRTGFTTRGQPIKVIPGYETRDFGLRTQDSGLPSGWTDRNLYRYAPDKYERTAARQGIQSASQIGLKLRFNRAGLKPMQLVQLDDHEFDVKLSFPGQLKSWRPRCFGAADVLASYLCHYTAKPTLWDAADEAKKTLNETDALWFVVSLLTDIGFRTDRLLAHPYSGLRTQDSGLRTQDSGLPNVSTIFHVEHGTMAVRDELAQRIFDATGGHVAFDRSGRFHTPAHGGQFAPPSGGNFRFKAIIEVFWRLINDRLDSLPGQTGLNRLRAPEEMERADAYTAKLLKAAAAMDPERAAQLIIPRLTWTEFNTILFDRVAAINDEKEHDLQQWEKCGFVLNEYRESPGSADWKPISPISPIGPIPDDCFRPRRMSRREAWQHSLTHSLTDSLTKLSPSLIPAIVGPRHALKCNGSEFLTVRNGIFEFEDWRIDSDPLQFLAVRSVQSSMFDVGCSMLPSSDNWQRLPEGSKWICYVNPMSPRCLVACDKDHRFVSECPPMPCPSRTDQHGIQSAMGLQKQWTARALAPMRDRHAEDADRVKFMRQHNEAVLSGKQTDQDKQRAKQLRRADLSADTLLDPAPFEVGSSELEVRSSAPAVSDLPSAICHGQSGSDPSSPDAFDPANLL